MEKSIRGDQYVIGEKGTAFVNPDGKWQITLNPNKRVKAYIDRKSFPVRKGWYYEIVRVIRHIDAKVPIVFVEVKHLANECRGSGVALLVEHVEKEIATELIYSMSHYSLYNRENLLSLIDRGVDSILGLYEYIEQLSIQNECLLANVNKLLDASKGYRFRGRMELFFFEGHLVVRAYSRDGLNEPRIVFIGKNTEKKRGLIRSKYRDDLNRELDVHRLSEEHMNGKGGKLKRLFSNLLRGDDGPDTSVLDALMEHRRAAKQGIFEFIKPLHDDEILETQS